MKNSEILENMNSFEFSKIKKFGAYSESGDSVVSTDDRIQAIKEFISTNQMYLSKYKDMLDKYIKILDISENELEIKVVPKLPLVNANDTEKLKEDFNVFLSDIIKLDFGSLGNKDIVEITPNKMIDDDTEESISYFETTSLEDFLAGFNKVYSELKLFKTELNRKRLDLVTYLDEISKIDFGVESNINIAFKMLDLYKKGLNIFETHLIKFINLADACEECLDD